ncbi:MAG: GxxExxY protein [Eubacteriales bacterium]
MTRILEKFVQHFDDIYGNQSIAFKEEEGRKYFLLYLKPIINGVGIYYIEAQTRDMRRTDIIIDYLGKQYIIEMKIWHGEEYNTRGEQQLTEYLDYYHLEKGYMLSFNFNENKEVGVKSIEIAGKILIEAVV